jgi:hypothetical protein
MKRIVLFVAANLAVVAVLSIVLSLLGEQALDDRELGTRRHGIAAASQDGAGRHIVPMLEHAFQHIEVGLDGDLGEVLVGLENDSPKCVPPTGLCSFRVSYRIRDNAGNVVSASSTNVSATADSCSALCEKAINNVAVKVVEVAAGVLKGDGNGPVDSGIPAEADAEVTTPVDAGSPSPDASAPVPRGSKKPRPKAEAPPPPKPDPLICSVGAGSRLPTAEAEKRAAQVEILKRLNVLDQDEYDCLRKAYLSRL